MKLFVILMGVAVVVTASAAGRSFRLKVSNTNTQAVLISASVVVDPGKKKFSVDVNLANAGVKPLQSLKWEYQTEENWNGDGFRTVTSGTAVLPKLLPPNRHRKVTLLSDRTVKTTELEEWLKRVDNPNGSVRITGMQFADGSQWIVPTENQSDGKAQHNKALQLAAR